jgi:hypothetical protein
MSDVTTSFSGAAYSPNGTAPNAICDRCRPLLHTDAHYRVDRLVNQIAQQFFNVDPEENFHIRVRRNLIEITMDDEDRTVHTLNKDDSTGIWTASTDGAAATDIDPKDQLQLAADASTIIERVKALWLKCQADRASATPPGTTSTSHPSGSCHGHGSQQPIIIHHCCHGHGHGSGTPNLQAYLDRIERLNARIRDLEAALAPRHGVDVAIGADDDNAQRMREELDQLIRELDLARTAMVEAQERARRAELLAKREADDRPDAPIGAPRNWADVLRDYQIRRNAAERIVEGAIPTYVQQAVDIRKAQRGAIDDGFRRQLKQLAVNCFGDTPDNQRRIDYAIRAIRA